MKIGRRQFTSFLLVLTGLSITTTAQDTKKGAEVKVEPASINLRGRIVCLTEEYERLFNATADCGLRGHVYSLKTTDEKLYPILPTDSAAAIFLDERYRQRELQIAARLFPAGNFIEVITIQSWRNGQLHDMGYFCEVCNIWTHKPGPCDCCQEPVEFRESRAEPTSTPQ